MESIRNHPSAAAALLSLVLLTPLASAQWTFVDLHPEGELQSLALGGDGPRQVGRVTMLQDQRDHAYLWNGSAASAIDLHPAGYLSSQALCAWGDRQGGYASYGGFGGERAGFWSGTAESWTSIHPPTVGFSKVLDMNATLQVGFTYGPTRAALWAGTAASWIDLTPLGADRSQANAIDGDKQGGWARMNGIIGACLWTGTPQSFVDLHPSTTEQSEIYGMGDGQQVGYVSVGGVERAALWSGSAATWVDLAPAGATNSRALGCAAGLQAGHVFIPGSGRMAVIWNGTAASMENLSLAMPSGWTWAATTAVWIANSTLYVSGVATAPSGQTRAVMWSRPFTPSCYPNCDNSTQSPILNVADFSCFLTKFASGDPYANCDGSTTQPILSVSDFSCFLTKFAAGCP